VIWVDFSPQAGHEQSGRRPALVLSPRNYNERSSVALACPITSRIRDWPFEVRLPSDGPVTGVVLADQIRSLDWRARGATIAGRVPRTVLADVQEKVRLLLA
jgi:mRNA interferase MazF